MPEHIALEKVEPLLKDLVEKLLDTQEGFRELGARLENEQAKRFFLEETQRRAGYAAELENELHRMGVADVKASPSPVAKARLFLGEVQASLAGGQKALLSTAERGDERALDAYAKALKADLPLPLRETLNTQRECIQRARDQAKALRALG